MHHDHLVVRACVSPPSLLTTTMPHARSPRQPGAGLPRPGAVVRVFSLQLNGERMALKVMHRNWGEGRASPVALAVDSSE